MKIEGRTGKFFYKLLTTKPPGKNKDDKEFFVWLLKYLLGLSFFKLHSTYYDFWRWATRYFPFSILYQDRLFHYDNLPVNEFMIELERLILKKGIKTTILKGEYESLFCVFYGLFDKKSDKSPENIEIISSLLQAKYNTVYTSLHESGFKIIVPTEMLKSMNVLRQRYIT